MAKAYWFVLKEGFKTTRMSVMENKSVEYHVIVVTSGHDPFFFFKVTIIRMKSIYNNVILQHKSDRTWNQGTPHWLAGGDGR